MRAHPTASVAFPDQFIHSPALQLLVATMAVSAPPVPPRYDSFLCAGSGASAPVSVYRVCYAWTIPNFRLCGTSTGDYVISPCFSPEEDRQMLWCIKLSPNGFTESSEGYLSLYAMLVDSKSPEVFARLRFCLRNNRGEDVNVMDEKETRTFIQGKSCGFDKFILRDLVQDEEMLRGGKLTVCCEIIAVCDTENPPRREIREITTDQHLVDDLEVLFDTKTFSDVALVAGDTEIKVHQAILGGRSPVFSALFEKEGKGEDMKRIKIHGIRPDILERVCRYMYTGKIHDLELHDKELLVASERFFLETLKAKCERSLIAKVTIQNAANTVILATNYGANILKAYTIDFIRAHVVEVRQTAGWLTLVDFHTLLVCEIFNEPASKSSSKETVV
ncbi:speckle-type POZ protein-like [Ischnura elegans]|uniref:speckle-type POZ protein-like n=1 Tax=Ischnura elegans TaxID=197161 RepID=UPI001ED869C2|nr:speckle-type POZ protein-like [Ischnura elegans]